MPKILILLPADISEGQLERIANMNPKLRIEPD